MTETEFEQAVVDLAHTFGWRVAAFRPARQGQGWVTPVKYDGAGFPDLTLAHHSGMVGPLFRELKVPPNTTTPAQKAWLAVLGPDARVWTPADGDEIADTLSFGRITRWDPTDRPR